MRAAGRTPATSTSTRRYTESYGSTTCTRYGEPCDTWFPGQVPHSGAGSLLAPSSGHGSDSSQAGMLQLRRICSTHVCSGDSAHALSADHSRRCEIHSAPSLPQRLSIGPTESKAAEGAADPAPGIGIAWGPRQNICVPSAVQLEAPQYLAVISLRADWRC